MAQVLLEAFLVPFQGPVQADGPSPDVQGSVQHPFMPGSHDGHCHWYSFGCPPGPQGRRLGKDGGIREENHPPLPALQATL
jgi:hypothetical protein